MSGKNTQRLPEPGDLWEKVMSSASEATLFVITVQGGVQFGGRYNYNFSDSERIQLNEGLQNNLANRVHVILRSAIIAITTTFAK
jgi:hypothetical protein